MGNCFCGNQIYEDRKPKHKVVTALIIVFVDDKRTQEFEWLFIYSRRYISEGNVFSFEAGRKCAKANTLCNMVKRNNNVITHGGVQPKIDNNDNWNIEEFPFPHPNTTLPCPPEPDPPLFSKKHDGRKSHSLLPSSATKMSVYLQYCRSMESAGERACKERTFLVYWQKYLPSMKVLKAMSDLCWVCQKNSAAFVKSTNLPLER